MSSTYHEFIQHYGKPGETHDKSTWWQLYEVWQIAWSRGASNVEEHRPPALTDDERTALLAGANCLTSVDKAQAEILRGFVREDRPFVFGQWKARKIAGQLTHIAYGCTSKKDMGQRLLELAAGLAGDEQAEILRLECQIREGLKAA